MPNLRKTTKRSNPLNAHVLDGPADDDQGNVKSMRRNGSEPDDVSPTKGTEHLPVDGAYLCPCGINKAPIIPGFSSIQCSQCKKWQHNKCVGLDEGSVGGRYQCPPCNSSQFYWANKHTEQLFLLFKKEAKMLLQPIDVDQFIADFALQKNIVHFEKVKVRRNFQLKITNFLRGRKNDIFEKIKYLFLTQFGVPEVLIPSIRKQGRLVLCRKNNKRTIVWFHQKYLDSKLHDIHADSPDSSYSGKLEEYPELASDGEDNAAEDATNNNKGSSKKELSLTRDSGVEDETSSASADSTTIAAPLIATPSTSMIAQNATVARNAQKNTPEEQLPVQKLPISTTEADETKESGSTLVMGKTIKKEPEEKEVKPQVVIVRNSEKEEYSVFQFRRDFTECFGEAFQRTHMHKHCQWLLEMEELLDRKETELKAKNVKWSEHLHLLQTAFRNARSYSDKSDSEIIDSTKAIGLGDFLRVFSNYLKKAEFDSPNKTEYQRLGKNVEKTLKTLSGNEIILLKNVQEAFGLVFRTTRN